MFKGVRIKSVSFEIYGYLLISYVGRSKRRSLAATFIMKVINSEGAIRHLRKSNIIPDVGLTNCQFWKSDHIPIFGNLIVQNCTVNISYDFDSNRFRKYGRCCQPCTTATCMELLRYTVFYRRPVGQ